MAKIKTENKVEYPAAAYLYVPDPASPDTWKLRYKNFIDGKLQLDPAQLGKAVAAFSAGGFRGQKVDMPDADKKKVMAKMRSIYTKTLKTKEADLPDTLRNTQDMSFADIRSALWDALQNLSSLDPVCVEEVYPDYVIYSLGAAFFKRSYSIMDDVVTLGDNSVEVEETWVETETHNAQDEEFSLIIRLGQAQNPEGTAWDVVICETGFTKNGCFIPDETLRLGAAMFEGLDVNLYELPKGATHLPDPLFDIKSLLVKNKVGWLDNVKHVVGKGLTGVVHFVDSAKWLGKNMLDAMNQGKNIYGLSWDALIRGTQAVIEGKNVLRIDGFNKADSLDVVSRPAAGGKFIRAVAAMPAQKEEDEMKKLLALIQERRSDLLKGKDVATITDQEIEVLARQAMDVPTNNIDTTTLATKDEMAIFRCEMALKEKLGDDKLELPAVSKERIQKAFVGRVYLATDLDKAIADEKDYLAKIHTANRAAESIMSSGITGGLGSFDRACMAADRMFGLKKDDMVNLAKLTRLDNKPFFTDVRNVQDYDEFDKVPAFSSLREMYTYFTGDPEVTGRINRKAMAPELRSSMDISSATFTYVLGNTLGRRLVQIYKAIAYMEELLISVKKPARDFRLQEAVLVGGFADLSTVDPESGDYLEVAGVTDEESSYTIGQKGNILTITRKTIINDDISIIQRLIDGLGRAARRTHAKYVWNKFINNENCSDGTAWFTGGGAHVNLGTSALTFATALIAYKALATMTEKDSGERIGLLSDPSVKPNLVGPVDIMETINRIATEDFYYSTNDLTNKTPNALKGKINAVINPLFTDANDWGLLLPPQVIDMVEMGYLNGREEPELFVADMPQSEQVFVADKIRHKIRHEYAGAVIDYRSGYKASV
jgi:hypothetical protein